MFDITADVQIGPVFQTITHRAVCAFFEPATQVRRCNQLRRHIGHVFAFEHRDVVREKALGPEVPLRIRNRSEEHTSELQSLMRISYAVFCLKKKKQTSNYKMQTQHNKITTLSR